MVFRRRSLPIDCRLPNAFCPPRAAIAASPTSTWALRAPRSAAHSAVRKTRGAAERRARTLGRRTCAGRRTPSTGVRNCLWLREFASTSECRARASSRYPRFDLGGTLFQSCRRDRAQRLQLLRVQRYSVFFDPATEIIQFRDPAQLGAELFFQSLITRPPPAKFTRNERRLSAARGAALPAPLLRLQIARQLP